MVATAIEHILAMSLVLIAIVSSAAAMAQVSYYNVASSLEGSASKAYTVQQALFTAMRPTNGGLNALAIDRLDELSQTYELAAPSLFKPYGTLLTDLKLQDIDFHLSVEGGLSVAASSMGGALNVSVLQPFSRRGVPAEVKAYVLGSSMVLETLAAETNIQGGALLQPTTRGAVVIFAHRGASVGFGFLNASSAEGSYVRDGRLQPNPPSPYFILSADGYTGPLTSGVVDVSAYTLPVAVAWSDGVRIRVLAYPHLPIDYGPQPSGRAVSVMTTATVQGSIFQVRLQVWGSGGEYT